MKKKQIKIEFDKDIFNPVYIPYLDNDSRFLHLWGGAGSGKSVFAVQKIIIRLLEEANHKFLVARKTFRSHRHSTFALFLSMINQYGLTDEFKFNQSDLTITNRKNGNQVIFYGVDDVEKLKSITDITNIWIEEATELYNNDIRQINLRLRGETKYYKQIILTYNPIDEYHFINNDFHKKQRMDTTLLKTTYLDNIFIDEQYKEQLMNLQNEDPTYYKIYSLGEWATFKGLIYSNWCVDIVEPSHYEDICFGLDLGYTNDPTALIKIGKIGNDLYLKKYVYQTHLLNPELIQIMKGQDIGRSPIYSDIDNELIDELRRAGFNVYQANKDVQSGIDFTKRYRLHIVDSPEIESELKTYKWKEDKTSGSLKNEPVKFRDHGCDGFRYGIFTHGIKFWSNFPDVLIPSFPQVQNKFSYMKGY